MSHKPPHSSPSPRGSRSPRAAVFLTFLALLVIGFFVPFDVRLYRELTERLSDAMHFPLFVFITFLLRSVLSKSTLSAPLLALLLVFGVEVLQPLTGRAFGEVDIVNGLLGVLLVELAVRLQIRKAQYPRKLLYALGALVTGGIVFFPVYRAAQAEILQSRLFPVLSSFEHRAEFTLWRTAGPILPSANYFGPTDIWRKDGSQAMVFISKGDGFGGLVYNAGDRDWSRYQTLVIPLTVSNGSIEFGVRVDDDQDCRRYDDRFNAHFTLAPGEHELRIPLRDIQSGPAERDLNLKRVRRVVLFVGPHVLARQIVFDAIRLETLIEADSQAPSQNPQTP